MKTLALEEIYADPHTLDALLSEGETISLMRDGKLVADLVPRRNDVESAPLPHSKVNFRQRFLQMWGPDAFDTQASTEELFEELRSPREF